MEPVGTAESELGRLLSRAMAGSAPAFERIYDELAAPVASYLRWNGASDADEVTNQVMANVHQGLPSFVGDWTAFRSWVFTIAHHRLIDDRRASGRRPVVVDESAADHAEVRSVEEDAMQRLGDDEVRRLLSSLSPDQRDVLLLRVVADLPLEEVAENLQKSVGAVKSLQHRALATLRRHLAVEEVEG
jgi:RNA polymerase sigma-70 factor (ECF subfamily)